MSKRRRQTKVKSIGFCFEYLKTFLKWVVISVAVGFLGGIVGGAFHLLVDRVTEYRAENTYLLLLLPVGGIVITFLYKHFAAKEHIDTNRVIESVRDNKNVPIVMVPLIFASTVITHMLGGSAGREGAALQLGGGIGYNVGKLLKLSERDMHIIVMSGMSSVFSALFGTPVTAAVFSLEVVSVGVFNYAGILPCVISSVCAYMLAGALGISPVRFENVAFAEVSALLLVKTAVLALLCALLSIVFCMTIEKCHKLSKKFLPNMYLRSVAGAVIIVALTYAVGTYDYNGAGMDVIAKAMSGTAEYEAFALKLLFTAITIAAGFKGGEIVPAFFVGSSFGCAFGPLLLGLDAPMAAALGFVSLFCGVVNCPVASMILAIEVFGTEGILYFAVACGVSYMLSGNFGLYKSQKIVYSKLDAHYIDENAK